MVAKTKNNRLFFLNFLAVTFITIPVMAENIEKNTAHMQAMDKITGRVSVIDVPVNGKIDFGSISVVVRSCQTRSAEEIPDNFAFVDVADKDLSGKESNIFKGWMISSSPATSAVEHPIYDVWLLKCIDKKIDEKLLLSQEELDERDELPSLKDSIKQKSVSNHIDEMQYENSDKKVETTKPEETDTLSIEFEMDEEAVDESADTKEDAEEPEEINE